MPKTNPWETYRLALAVVCMSGGHVISVPVDCRMSGRLVLIIGKAWTTSVLSVPTGNFANIIRC